jgi:reactive intermediate/imine deaminase
VTNQAEIRAINTTRSPQPQGAYSQAIVHAGIAYIAGQVPRRPDGTLVNDQPFETQARQALANLETVAHAAGGSLRSALSVTVWLRDLDDKPVFEAVWSEFVHKPYPARAVVHSALNDLSLELSAIIAVERPKEIS